MRGHELEFAAAAPQGFARARGPAGQCGLVSSGHGRGCVRACAAELVRLSNLGVLQVAGYCADAAGPSNLTCLHVPPSRAGACACGRAGGAGT